MDELVGRRLDDGGNSTSQSQFNSTSPSQGNSTSPLQSNSTSPYYGQGNSSSKPASSAVKYVVPIVCSVLVLALVIALVLWWISRSRRLTPQLGRPVQDQEMALPPPNRNKAQGRDNRPKPLTLRKIKRITNNFKDLLGQGAFGKVYLGNLDGNQIAVKQLTYKGQNNLSTEQFESEMGILMEVKHKNLVKFLAYCNKGEKRYLCFEFLSGGSLDKLLYASKHNENEKPFSRENDILLDWESRYYIMKEVCTGLHYLHAEWSSAEKILHLDLKAGNILIDQGGVVVKIADFGISRLFDAHRTYEYLTNKFILGMRAYLPQECLTAKPKVSDKVDIYSYGMLLLEMVTGWCATDCGFPCVPRFKELALEALGNGDVKKLIDHTLRERLEDHSVPQVLNCIRIACDCLNDDPKQRPDTKQIAQRLDH